MPRVSISSPNLRHGQAGSPSRVPQRWAELARENVAACRGEYRALADPLSVIEVNPRDIRHRCLMHSATRLRDGSKFHDWGRIVPGDWDLEWDGRQNPSILGSMKWVAVFRRYAEGLSWEETGIIDATMQRIARGERVTGGLRTREEVLGRYKRLDAVFADIRDSGFRLTHEAGGEFNTNLCVSIGRNGRLLRSEGANHRLPIAVLLGLPLIPVYVLSRHPDWQVVRERCAAAGQGQGRRERVTRPSHPDLADL